MIVNVKKLGFYTTKVMIENLGGKKHLKNLPCGYKSTTRAVKLNGDIEYIKIVKTLDGTIYLEETSVTKDRYNLGKF